MFSDMTKWANPEEIAKMFQTSFDMQSVMDKSKQNMEVAQQANSIMAETMSSCMECQVQMMQSSVQDTMNAMKDLTSSSSVEELMNKQSVLARKTAEQAQANSQELAQMIQKGQSQIMEMVSQQTMENLQATVDATKAATKSK